jgi:hypothetical protein
MLAIPPNKALQPTAGRRTEMLKEKVKATLGAASGG